MHLFEVAGPVVAQEAARNYRRLRVMGITVRKTIDMLIATRCIRDRLSLLYADWDVNSLVAQLGLVSALPARTGHP